MSDAAKPTALDTLPLSPELEVIQRHKQGAINYRQPRHNDWTEIYMLYRDRVITNRITQRQSVNLPMIKLAIRTLLKNIDDPPMLFFEHLGNDKQAEIYMNSYWEWRMGPDQDKLSIRDIVDKRQVLLFGRSFKALNVKNRQPTFTIRDPQDVLVDRNVDPVSIDTARFFADQRVFIPLSTLASDERLDKDAINRLRIFYATREGLIKAEDNNMESTQRNDRMRILGVIDVDNPILGETMVECTKVFMYEKDPTSKRGEILFYKLIGENEILYKKPLRDHIGPTQDDYWSYHLPYNSWGDEVESTDFWNDGIGDILRSLAKQANIWWSQKAENRTLVNFGMRFYDATSEEGGEPFVPQTFEPKPFGWFPIPGDPNSKIKDVNIPSLSDSLEDLNFIFGMAEKASGATSTEQGVPTSRQVTLGEIQLTLQEAKDRIQAMSKFYNDAWYEFGMKYMKLIEAAGDKIDPVVLYKKGYKGNIYEREVWPKNFKLEKGYSVKIVAQSEKNQQDIEALQKLRVARADMPDNLPLKDISQKKTLEFAGLNPEEVQEVLRFEKNKPTMPTGVTPGQNTPQVQPPIQPQLLGAGGA